MALVLAAQVHQVSVAFARCKRSALCANGKIKPHVVIVGKDGTGKPIEETHMEGEYVAVSDTKNLVERTAKMPSRRPAGGHSMNLSTRIRWMPVLIGGSLVEVSLFAVVIPVLKLFGQHALLYVVPVASFVMCFVFGLCVGRRVESRFVLHGMLVGIVATLLYVGMTHAHVEPFAYVLAHGLKIVGGAAGGFLAQRRAGVSYP